MMTIATKIGCFVVFAGIVFAGCGGSTDGSDPATPESVAEAYIESFYLCGKDGAGVRADLVYPEDKAQAHRDAIAEEEAPGGCQPAEVKEASTARVPSREPGIPAAVEVSNSDCGVAEIPLIQVDGDWLVDETEVDPLYACDGDLDPGGK